MKIAVLLVGQTRTFDIAWPHIQKEFNFGDDVEVDYFCHTWASEVNFTPWNDMLTIDDRFSFFNKLDINEINKKLDLCSPKKRKIGEYNDMEDLYTNVYYPESKKDNPLYKRLGFESFDKTSTMAFDNWIYFSSLLGQFYSSTEAMKLMQEYEKETNTSYDLVIRWRYDLISNHHIRDLEGRRAKWIKNIDKNTVYFNIISLWKGMPTAADHYWHGDAASMKTFTSNLDLYYIKQIRNKILTKFQWILNENFMIEIIMDHNMNARSTSIGTVPVRPGANNTMSYTDFINLANDHERKKRSMAAALGGSLKLPTTEEKNK